MTIDSLGVGDALAALPEQLATAHERAGAIERALLPQAADITNVVVLGMGGSGVIGDIVQTVGSGTLPVPVLPLKQYRTPAFVGPGTLAFAVSYSGDTEETVEMASGALDAGATVVAISRGGALAGLARSRDALHVACAPDIAMPRFALGELLAPIIVVLFRLGMMPDGHASLVMAQQQLHLRRDQCRTEIGLGQNPARELARRIDRTIPIVYGTGALGGVAALRWKQSINENAKAPAYWNQFPELDHNEVCGWGQHGDVTRQVFTLVELRHGLEHEQLDRRVVATRELIEEAVHQVLTVEAVGDGRLAQLLDLVYLGDWTSFYVALANDVDPGPIDAITQLKQRLAPT
jgi:glucose/mannose-6-phosphate isomerase